MEYLVNGDMEGFGPLHEDAKDRGIFETENQGENWLTQVYLETGC